MITRLESNNNSSYYNAKSNNQNSSHKLLPFSLLYDSSPDLFHTMNNKGIILGCNRFYSKNLGYSKNELIGTSIFETVAENSLASIRDSFESWKTIRKAGKFTKDEQKKIRSKPL